MWGGGRRKRERESEPAGYIETNVPVAGQARTGVRKPGGERREWRAWI